MTTDTAAVLATLVLVLLWPVHQELTIRALRHSLRRQRDQLAQHRRAIVQLQGAAIQPPTSVGQPMASVTGQHRAIGGELLTAKAGLRSLRASESRPAPACVADRDPTLRLHRPPAVTDVEYVLTKADRPLTRSDLAARLGVGTWDVTSDLKRLMMDGKVKLVPSHTAGEYGYAIDHPDPTHRLPHGMSVLPGLVRP